MQQIVEQYKCYLNICWIVVEVEHGLKSTWIVDEVEHWNWLLKKLNVNVETKSHKYYDK